MQVPILRLLSFSRPNPQETRSFSFCYSQFFSINPLRKRNPSQCIVCGPQQKFLCTLSHSHVLLMLKAWLRLMHFPFLLHSNSLDLLFSVRILSCQLILRLWTPHYRSLFQFFLKLWNRLKTPYPITVTTIKS